MSKEQLEQAFKDAVELAKAAESIWPKYSKEADVMDKARRFLETYNKGDNDGQ